MRMPKNSAEARAMVLAGQTFDAKEKAKVRCPELFAEMEKLQKGLLKQTMKEISGKAKHSFTELAKSAKVMLAKAKTRQLTKEEAKAHYAIVKSMIAKNSEFGEKEQDRALHLMDAIAKKAKVDSAHMALIISRKKAEKLQKADLQAVYWVGNR